MEESRSEQHVDLLFLQQLPEQEPTGTVKIRQTTIQTVYRMRDIHNQQLQESADHGYAVGISRATYFL
jgi:hypothetical protein